MVTSFPPDRTTRAQTTSASRTGDGRGSRQPRLNPSSDLTALAARLAATEGALEAEWRRFQAFFDFVPDSCFVTDV